MTLAQGSGDGTDLRPALSKALAGLKDLRSVMMAGTSEVEEHMKELAATKEENKKLKYQIKHLKRSLEAEEKYVDATTLPHVLLLATRRLWVSH